MNRVATRCSALHRFCRRWRAGWLLVAAVFGGFAFWRAELPEPSPARAPITSNTLAEERGVAFTKRIDQVHPGERTLGINPLDAETDVPLDVRDASRLRGLALEQKLDDGSISRAELIRAARWIDELGAKPGESVEVDLPEFGLTGRVNVVAVDPCPTIQPGPGNLVTGTFAHYCPSGLVEVHVRGLSEPITCTANHPYWSLDREDFVAADELQPGERLLGLGDAERRVVRLAQDRTPQWVYNLEIDRQHVYLVSAGGILVHNSCAVQAFEKGGGHHIFAKKAFVGVEGYDAAKALAIPQSEIISRGWNHVDVRGMTQTQRRLFKELAQSGRANTLAEQARIARAALRAGGLSAKDAADAVKKALKQLQSWGVTAPGNIPWY